MLSKSCANLQCVIQRDTLLHLQKLLGLFQISFAIFPKDSILYFWNSFIEVLTFLISEKCSLILITSLNTFLLYFYVLFSYYLN